MGLVYRDQGRLEEASEAFQRAMAAEPKEPVYVCNLGDVRLAQRRFEEAVALYRQALEIDPNNSSILNLMGLAYGGQRRLEEASDAFQRAMAAEPKEPVYVCNLGDVRLAQGRFEEAVALYQQALEIDPKHKWACGQLASVYQEHQQYDEALTWCQRGLEIDSNYGFARNLIGLIYENQGRLEEAADAYREAIEAEPKEPTYVCNLGDVRLAQGWFEEAVALYQQVLEIDPKYKRACGQLASVYQERQQYDEALAWCQRGLEIDPNYVHALTLAATICDKSARGAEAGEYRERLAQVAQQDPAAMLARGWDAYERRQFDDALPWLQQAVEMQPTSWGAYSKLSLVYQALCQYDDAVDVCERALDACPGQRTAIMIRKGFVLLDLQRYDKVEDICDRVLATQPRHLSALGLKGVSYRQREDYAEALTIYDTALQHYPRHPWLRSIRAFALGQWGRPEDLTEAKKVYEALLQDYGGHGDRWNWVSALAEVHLRRGEDEKMHERCREVLKQDPDDEYTHYVLGQYHYERKDFPEAKDHFEKANKFAPDANTCLLLGKVLEQQEPLHEALEQYREVLWRKQRFADSVAQEACERVGTVLAQLASQHRVEEVRMAIKDIVSVLPDEPIAPGEYFYPASLLWHFAAQSYNLWLEGPSHLVPIAEKIRQLLTEIEQSVGALVPGGLAQNWDTWQQIMRLRRQAYSLSYDLFSYLQGYWDEPADVEERLQDIRDRMLSDYWRLGIFELLPSLTIELEGQGPFTVRGVAAKIQALFRVLIRNLMELQAEQRPEVAAYIGLAPGTDARVSVQLAVPPQYREHVRQLYTARCRGDNLDWLLADQILKEYGGKLEITDGPQGPVGLRLEFDKARARKDRDRDLELMRRLSGSVCENPTLWRDEDERSSHIPSQIQRGIVRALGARSHWAARLPELLWLLYDEAGLSAARNLSECSGDVHGIKNAFLGGINELGAALDRGELTVERRGNIRFALRREIGMCGRVIKYLDWQQGMIPGQLIRLNLHKLNQLVGDVVAERESAADKSGVALEPHPGKEEGTETHAIDADEQRMRLAILDLLGNSLDAFEKRKRPPKTISIETELIFETYGPWALQLRYKDTAGGVPADVRRRLFSGRRVLSTKVAGSGSGLRYIHDTVRQHGGTFEIKVEPRRGTAFTITFPLPPKGGGRDSRPGPIQRTEPPAPEGPPAPEDKPATTVTGSLPADAVITAGPQTYMKDEPTASKRGTAEDEQERLVKLPAPPTDDRVLPKKLSGM